MYSRNEHGQLVDEAGDEWLECEENGQPCLVHFENDKGSMLQRFVDDKLNTVREYRFTGVVVTDRTVLIDEVEMTYERPSVK